MSSSSRLHPLAFWCHQCDMSISLPPSPSPLPCPHCHRSDSLLPLDSISPLSLTPLSPSQNPPDLPSPNPNNPFSAPPESISAIPIVQISDPNSLCAICKDDLPPGSSARRLPCSHLYHSDCIVPWLSLRNSCPLCRSSIPCSRRPKAQCFRIRVFEPDDVEFDASFRQIESNGVEMVASELPLGGGWGDGEGDVLADVIMSDVWEDFFA